ncbi:hypothetical protein JOD57_004111 [Geodermatophilus bullaregiensis]|uniref:DUF6544 family protein n=1 Tax=Geodermatophilus bullaregiensis TaxID=1564160 RepID=UPI00195A56C3|nr:DUF6544 family protein [Geodermatophilus bullaregiensis]MBM7808274.1 hypothetical protein [Geodermatophilus bullaregiensis]
MSTPDRPAPRRPPRASTRRVAAAGLPAGPAAPGPGTEDDLAGLPPVAARHLRATGVVGRPRTWSLLAPRTTGDAATDDGFRVSVSDAGDRWADLPGGPVRATWSTPVDGWTVVDGRARPVRGAAVWHLPGGAFRYAELAFPELRLDVPPGGRDR